jgi:hypothetical protein
MLRQLVSEPSAQLEYIELSSVIYSVVGESTTLAFSEASKRYSRDPDSEVVDQVEWSLNRPNVARTHPVTF